MPCFCARPLQPKIWQRSENQAPRTALSTHSEWGDSFVPDFILPCVPNLECPSLSRPMSYLQALVCLRWAIQLPWKSEGGQLVTQHEASSFTLHSLKCALLSAAAELRLPEDSRRLQGHHRPSSKYTIEALWVQSELSSAIRRGLGGSAPNRRSHRPALLAVEPPTASEPPAQPDKIPVSQGSGSSCRGKSRLGTSPTKSHQRNSLALHTRASPCRRLHWRPPGALGIRACRAAHSQQFRHPVACTSSIARTRCVRFTLTCSSANARRVWPCCAKINAHAPP